MTGYIGIGGTAKKIKNIYIGIGGTAKQIKKAYIGVGGVAKLWYRSQREWVWDVYQYGYNPVEGTSFSQSTSSAFYAGTTYTLNQTTGQFSVDQTTQIAKSSSGATNAVGKYLITLASSSGTQTGSTVYLITAASYNWLTGISLTLTPITAQIYRGTLVGTTVDLDGTAYPADGVQDGYWYVLRDLPAISYSGNLTKRIALMEDIYYLILEVTSSGTLAADVAVAADVWICGGGGAGYYAKGHGGAGAYAASANNVSIQDLVITIGSGDADNVSAGGSSTGVGGTTTITGDLSLSAAGGNCGGRVADGATVRASGGTGGGKGGLRKIYSGECLGDGLSKIPFNDNYFNSYCDGGGGGWGHQDNDIGTGGDGGTNGGDGLATTSLSGSGAAAGKEGGKGGGLYGGDGGSYRSSGQNATGYGSGGGGGGYDSSVNTTWASGAGYQGVCFIRIPLE